MPSRGHHQRARRGAGPWRVTRGRAGVRVVGAALGGIPEVVSRARSGRRPSGLREAAADAACARVQTGACGEKFRRTLPCENACCLESGNRIQTHVPQAPRRRATRSVTAWVRLGRAASDCRRAAIARTHLMASAAHRSGPRSPASDHDPGNVGRTRNEVPVVLAGPVELYSVGRHEQRSGSPRTWRSCCSGHGLHGPKGAGNAVERYGTRIAAIWPVVSITVPGMESAEDRTAHDESREARANPGMADVHDPVYRR